MSNNEMINKMRSNIEKKILNDTSTDDASTKSEKLQSELLPLLTEAKKDKTNPFLNKVVSQSLQQSGFNSQHLIKHLYGAKITESLESLLAFHSKLIEVGATDHQNKLRYNEFGDNYHSAYTISKNLDHQSIDMLKMIHVHNGLDESDFSLPTYKVVISENQDAMFALIIEEPEMYKESFKIHFVRLKRSYTDNNKITELFDILNSTENIKSNYNWFIRNNISKSYGLITSVDVSNQICNKLQNIEEVEHCLFNIYQGLESFSANPEIVIC